MAKTWILTGSLDNFRATRDHGFRVIGAKEGRRGMAEQIEPGDRIVFYVTGVQAFGGIVRGHRRDVRGPREDLARQAGQGGHLPVALRDRAGDRARRGRLRARRRARRASSSTSRKWPAEHWHAGLPGPAAHRLATPTPSCSSAGIREAAPAPRRDSAHDRHYTLEEAAALLPRVAELIERMRARPRPLGDREAREALSDGGARPTAAAQPGTHGVRGLPRAARRR